MDEILEILLEPGPIHEDIAISILLEVSILEVLIRDGILVPWHDAIFSATESTRALLAFTIQKWIDPDEPVDIKVRGLDFVCTGSRLYEDEPLYRWIPPPDMMLREVGTCPLPWGKDDIMRWLYLIRFINDELVSYIDRLIDEALEPGSDFYEIIMESPVIADEWRILILLSILKTKVIRLSNAILKTYTPDTCEVPND